MKNNPDTFVVNLKKIHLIIFIAFAFISFSVSLGGYIYQHFNYNQRIVSLEILANKRLKLLYELKFNLKEVMERNGYKYHEINGSLDITGSE